MPAASLLDGFSFDLFPPFENGPAAPEVDVSQRQVVQALVRVMGSYAELTKTRCSALRSDSSEPDANCVRSD